MDVLLIPDCGPAIGLGHLERALALADHLRAHTRCRIVVPRGDTVSRERVAARGHAWMEAAGDPGERATAACPAVKPDVVVIDAYGLPPEAQAELRRPRRLVVIDDLGGPCDCDLAINPAPGGEALRPAGAEDFLGGAAFAMLAAAYRHARGSRTASGASSRSVLLSAGGTAMGGLTGRVARALLDADAVVRVVAVRGPHDGDADLPVDDRVEVLATPPTLAGALAAAAVYAGAAGTTAVQAACVGVPAVIVPAVANQVAQAEALATAGCAQLASPEDIARRTVELLDDPTQREAMSQRGRALVDGRGAERAAEAVLALAAGVVR